MLDAKETSPGESAVRSTTTMYSGFVARAIVQVSESLPVSSIVRVDGVGPEAAAVSSSETVSVRSSTSGKRPSQSDADEEKTGWTTSSESGSSASLLSARTETVCGEFQLPVVYVMLAPAVTESLSASGVAMSIVTSLAGAESSWMAKENAPPFSATVAVGGTLETVTTSSSSTVTETAKMLDPEKSASDEPKSCETGMMGVVSSATTFWTPVTVIVKAVAQLDVENVMLLTTAT